MKVQFLQYETVYPVPSWEVVHEVPGSLIAEDLELSGVSLSGESFFLREPRRCTFRCIMDGFLRHLILDGHEHPHYISRYEVRLVDSNNQALFHGVIFTSECEIDFGLQVATISAYDHTSLLQAFDGLSGISPAIQYPVNTLLEQYFGRIRMYGVNEGDTTSHIAMPLDTSESAPLEIEVSGEEILRVDWGLEAQKLLREVSLPDGCSQKAIQVQYAEFGIGDWGGGSLYVLLSHYVKVIAWQPVHGGPSNIHYYSIKRNVLWRVHNRVCPLEIAEVKHTKGWYTGSDDDPRLELEQQCLTNLGEEFEEATGESAPGSWPVTSSRTYEGQVYAVTGGPGPSSSEPFSLRITGNIVPDILEFGDPLKADERTDWLDGVRAMLFLHNHTLYGDAQGGIRLCSHAFTHGGDVLVLAEDQVSECRMSRLEEETPDTSVFDALTGDTEYLQSKIADYYRGYQSGRTVVEFTTNEAVEINQRIGFVFHQYVVFKVVSVETDVMTGVIKCRAVEV